MLTYKPNIVLSNKEYKVVGTRPIRHDGAEKVTGRAAYGADVRLPGLLYGKILRSPHAHARIKSIDTRHAAEVPGVHAIITSDDLAQPSGRVVDLAEGAPLLHERLAPLTNPRIRPGGFLNDDDPTPGSNLANHFEFRLGDIDKGFQEAEVIVEHETHTSPVHQGYIEPHTGTAMWNSDGSLTIWSSSQGHFTVRDMTARLMNVPVSKVRAIPLEIGGGFGGKTLVYVEPVAAALARKTGRPVKVTMSRTEVFEATGPTSGTHNRVKLGATKAGKLVAAEAHLVYEAGAFPGSPVVAGCNCIMGAYDVPNAWIEGYDVVVNRPKSAAYRAPGTPAAAFVMETAIDQLCDKLSMDPLEFRLLNSAKEGTRRATGPVFQRVGFVETLQAAKDHPHYSAPLEGPYRG